MSRQDPTKLMNAVTLAATRTATFGAAGCDALSFLFVHTNVAATEITAYLEYSPDGGTTWCRWVGMDDSIDTTTTPDSYLRKAYQRRDQNPDPANLTAWQLDFEGYFHSNMRLSVTNTSGGATDILTVYIVRHYRK